MKNNHGILDLLFSFMCLNPTTYKTIMRFNMEVKMNELKDIKCFLLDMDGTFYLGNTIIDGALDF